MRRKYIVLVLLMVMGALLYSVSWNIAAVLNAKLGWPEVATRNDGCGPICPSGMRATLWERSCVGLKLRGPIVTDGDLDSYCLGYAQGELQQVPK